MPDQVQNQGEGRPDRLASPYLDASLATTCDRLALPHQFTAPAEALVAMAELAPGGLILDVGSGTGAVAIPAARVVGTTGRVIALDASVEMLRLLQAKAFDYMIAGQLPGLPFRDDLFDAVLGSFVLSHLTNYQIALEDVVRVLRPGGRLGFTAWARAQSEYAELWREVVGRFLNLDDLLLAFHTFIPWEEWFSDGQNIQRALDEAGLVQVDVQQRSFLVRLSVSDYLSIREGSVEGTLVRRALDLERWNSLSESMLDAFQSRFQVVEYWRDVHFAFGRKP